MAEKKKVEKARYWAGVLYPENLRNDWQDDIDMILEFPYVYCVHDKDFDSVDDDRKVHVHLMLAYSNTTTEGAVLRLINKLSAPGKTACSTVQAVGNVRYMYEYLIHNTDNARKKNKYQYEKSERICGNSFDIGDYEQISLADKKRMSKELCDFICKNNITNFQDFYHGVMNNYGDEYFELIEQRSGFYNRLINGCWQKLIEHR